MPPYQPLPHPPPATPTPIPPTTLLVAFPQPHCSAIPPLLFPNLVFFPNSMVVVGWWVGICLLQLYAPYQPSYETACYATLCHFNMPAATTFCLCVGMGSAFLQSGGKTL